MMLPTFKSGFVLLFLLQGILSAPQAVEESRAVLTGGGTGDESVVAEVSGRTEGAAGSVGGAAGALAGSVGGRAGGQAGGGGSGGMGGGGRGGRRGSGGSGEGFGSSSSESSSESSGRGSSGSSVGGSGGSWSSSFSTGTGAGSGRRSSSGGNGSGMSVSLPVLSVNSGSGSTGSGILGMMSSMGNAMGSAAMGGIEAGRQMTNRGVNTMANMMSVVPQAMMNGANMAQTFMSNAPSSSQDYTVRLNYPASSSTVQSTVSNGAARSAPSGSYSFGGNTVSVPSVGLSIPTLQGQQSGATLYLQGQQPSGYSYNQQTHAGESSGDDSTDYVSRGAQSLANTVDLVSGNIPSLSQVSQVVPTASSIGLPGFAYSGGSGSSSGGSSGISLALPSSAIASGLTGSVTNGLQSAQNLMALIPALASSSGARTLTYSGGLPMGITVEQSGDMMNLMSGGNILGRVSVNTLQEALANARGNVF